MLYSKGVDKMCNILFMMYKLWIALIESFHKDASIMEILQFFSDALRPALIHPTILGTAGACRPSSQQKVTRVGEVGGW